MTTTYRKNKWQNMMIVVKAEQKYGKKYNHPRAHYVTFSTGAWNWDRNREHIANREQFIAQGFGI